MTVSVEILEGRLFAQRRLLVRLLAELAPGLGGQAWLDRFMPDTTGVADAQEDPGAVPDPAFAVEAAVAQEHRLMAAEVRRILAGLPQDPAKP
ncbi:hypothetical protein [Phaeovulum sp.]|uniref:hypothetical protein n=1 Tax=Phaeovulum sp. TaxID=2934796 RepID=UPI0039E56E29